jgi:ABC-type proline/glycine betaine transport system substrate-binding protein
MARDLTLADLVAAVAPLPTEGVVLIIDASALGENRRVPLADVTWDSESFVIKLVAGVPG